MSADWKFREELRSLLNRASLENGSDTPDYILSTYLLDCLAAFDKAVKARSKWYGYPERKKCSELNDKTQYLFGDTTKPHRPVFGYPAPPEEED